MENLGDFHVGSMHAEIVYERVLLNVCIIWYTYSDSDVQDLQHKICPTCLRHLCGYLNNRQNFTVKDLVSMKDFHMEDNLDKILQTYDTTKPEQFNIIHVLHINLLFWEIHICFTHKILWLVITQIKLRIKMPRKSL